MSSSVLPAEPPPATFPLGLLAAAGFLSALGARIVDPLLSVLARDFQTSVASASLLVAAFTLPYASNQLLIGPLGDRFGKLRVLLIALSGYTIFMTSCALASGLPTLVLLRACAGACSGGLIPTCLAYIGDSVAYEQRQAALGRFLTGVVIAQALAGPLGGLFSEFVGWRGVFVLLGACGLTVALTLLTRIRHLPQLRHQRAIFDGRNYRIMLGYPPARLLLLFTLVEGVLLPGAFPFVAPYLVDHFGLSYAAAGLVLSAFGIGALCYTNFAPHLLRRFGEAGLVLAGGMLVAGALAFGFAGNLWADFIFVQAALGLGYFMLHGVMQARATEMLPDARATAVSSFVFMLFVGQGLGALVMGSLIGALGFRAAFWLDASGVMMLALVLAAYIHRSRAHIGSTGPA